uniref:Thaumatin-like protein n=1 Tax=Ananas comosus var. bracteatus TaxID=296719 RepID=A0A6V7Q750_ANACO|nr:unnamed protein product [Ananas comosus var. bracteatus]
MHLTRCKTVGGGEDLHDDKLLQDDDLAGGDAGRELRGRGFALKAGQSIVFTAPVGWSGRIWARTGCDFDSAGNGSCQTGACGSSLKCGASGKPPATLAEFTLAALDFYDVSLVDGFNLPVTVTPVNAQQGGKNCSAAGCDRDLRTDCPAELAVREGGRTVACRSACDVFDTDQYCCRGVFGNAATCQPTFYSKKFKDACPTAYSYAYDDPPASSPAPPPTTSSPSAATVPSPVPDPDLKTLPDPTH